MFEREELLALLDTVPPIQKAMVLLAINGGLGNHDIAVLPIKAVNLNRLADLPASQDRYRAANTALARNDRSTEGDPCQSSRAQRPCPQEPCFHHPSRANPTSARTAGTELPRRSCSS